MSPDKVNALVKQIAAKPDDRAIDKVQQYLSGDIRKVVSRYSQPGTALERRLTHRANNGLRYYLVENAKSLTDPKTFNLNVIRWIEGMARSEASRMPESRHSALNKRSSGYRTRRHTCPACNGKRRSVCAWNTRHY